MFFHEDTLCFSEIRTRLLACVFIVHIYRYASSGAIRAFDTYCVCTYTDERTTLFECRIVPAGGWFSSLRISISAHVDVGGVCADTYTVAQIHTNARYTYRRFLSSLLYCNRCLLLRAARTTLSRFRLLRFSNFCLPLLASLPSSFASFYRYSRRNVFRPFCHVIGH